jgi:Castor and Pollux, part of voltage-gated ion channel
VGIETYSELTGQRFEDIYFRFDRAIPIGVISSKHGQLLMCPRPDYILREGDELCLIRCKGSAPLQPLGEGLLGAAGGADGWAPCGAGASDELCEVRRCERGRAFDLI